MLGFNEAFTEYFGVVFKSYCELGILRVFAIKQYSKLEIIMTDWPSAQAERTAPSELVEITLLNIIPLTN